MYLQKSKIKKRISTAGFRTGAGFLLRLDAEVERLIDQMISVAKADHRKTLTAEHFELSKTMKHLR